MSPVNISTHIFPLFTPDSEIICNLEFIHPDIHILSQPFLHTHTQLSLATYKAWPYFSSHYPVPCQVFGGEGQL